MFLFDTGSSIDVITLTSRLRTTGDLEKCGGLVAVSAIPDHTPSSANLPHYIEIALGKWKYRQLIKLGSRIQSSAQAGNEVEKITEEAERELLRVSQAVAEDDTTLVKAVIAATDYFEKLWASDTMLGLTTGFTDLDRMTGGLEPGEVMVMAARPSVGKSSLAMNMAENIALQQNKPVGIFSLEMSRDMIVRRMICSQSRVSEYSIRSKRISEIDLQKMAHAAGRISRTPIYICDRSGLTISQMKSEARRMRQRHKIELLVVDYLQLIQSPENSDGRQNEIANVSIGIKAIATELKIPVIALAQLNRAIEKRKDKRPVLSDLRESGAIEQDADIVGLMWRTGEDDDESETIPIKMALEKHRNGPRGDIEFVFRQSITRFESASMVQHDEPQTSRHRQPDP